MITGARKARTRVNISPLPGVNREAEFRRLLVVYGIIADVPWEEDESEAFDADIELMRQTVEDGVNQRGETINPIPYDAMEWRVSGTKLSFQGFPDDLYHKARKFALYEIITHNWRSLETIKGYLKNLVRFFTLYKESEPYVHMAYIHASDIVSFFEGCDIALSSKCNILKTLVEFYKFFKINYTKERLPVDIEQLQEYYQEISQLYSRTRESGRFPTIPDKVFYQLDFVMKALMRNPGVPFDDAVTSCLVLLHLWTGLRPKEIRWLRRRCLVARVEQGETLYFYEYVSPKNKNRIQTFLLLPVALEAMKKLESLQTRRENVYITDYLVSFWDHQVNEPESYDTVMNAYNNLLCKYMAEELRVPYHELTRIERKGVVIYRPCLYSYRVHLCTYLIDHGCDERWVEAHLGHLSQTIRGRYYRMKEWRRDELRKEVASAIPEADDMIAKLTLELQARRPKDPPVFQSLEARLIAIINSNKQ